jgi:hypothetical protein
MKAGLNGKLVYGKTDVGHFTNRHFHLAYKRPGKQMCHQYLGKSAKITVSDTCKYTYKTVSLSSKFQPANGPVTDPVSMNIQLSTTSK